MTELQRDASFDVAGRVDAFMRGALGYDVLVRELTAAAASADGGVALRRYLETSVAGGGLPAHLVAALRGLAALDRPHRIEADDSPTQRTGPRRVYGGALSSVPGGGAPLLAGDRFGRLIGTVLAGRYEVDAVIGPRAAGMALRATDLGWPASDPARRRVAITVLDERIAEDPAAVARLLKAAGRVRALGHPAFEGIREIIRDNGRVFAVSEHRPGRSLSSLLAGEQGPGWPLRVVLPIGHRIADGLGEAHRAGMVHGGLDLGCVLLTADQEEVVVLDLGVRTALAPPDGGRAADPRDDVLGLARIVHALLSGAPMEVDAARGAPRPPALREAAWRALLQGLAAEPAGRPASAEALMVSLEDPGWLGRLVGRRLR